MKHILFFILFAASFSAQAQPYISTDGPIILQAGSIQTFDTPDILIDVSYNVSRAEWSAHLTLYKPGSDAIYGEHNLAFTKVDINGYTGIGTYQTDEIQNAVSLAVQDYLEAINPARTFTQN